MTEEPPTADSVWSLHYTAGLAGPAVTHYRPTYGRYFNWCVTLELDEDYVPGRPCPILHDGTPGLYIKVFRETARIFKAYCHYSVPVRVGELAHLCFLGTATPRPIKPTEGCFLAAVKRQEISLDMWELCVEPKCTNHFNKTCGRHCPY